MMSERHPSGGETGDELHVEVSDTPPSPASQASTRRPLSAANRDASASPFASRLTRRGRALRAGGIVGAVLLALLVVLGGFPATRDAARAWLASLHPTPTAPPFVAYDHFYLLPNPPGTTVLLDGTALATLPYPGDPHPLALARGRHTFKWLNNAFPFPSLTCQLSLPAARGDTCLVLAPHQVQPNPPAIGPVLNDPVIGTHLALNALPADQSSALHSAVQAALDALTTTVTLQPGDHYFDLLGGGLTSTTSRPLNVTLTLTAAPSLAGPCYFIAPAHPCFFLGQDCAALCTFVGAALGTPVVYNGVQPVWIAAVFVSMSMRYATADGKLVASNVYASSYGIEEVLLGVLWDGTNWHVLPLLGHRAALPPSDDLVCDPAFETLGQSPISYLFSPTAADSPSGVAFDVTLDYASGPNPTDGCAVRLAGDPHAAEPAIPGDGTALFFERLGVLLAASDAAHQLWPELPQASAAERQEAEQLAAQLG